MLRVVGGLLIAGGLIWIFFASQVDVSVSGCDSCETSSDRLDDLIDQARCLAQSLQCSLEESEGLRSRVVNLGLQSDRNNSFLLAGLTTLSGVILFAVSFLGGKNTGGTAGTTIDQGITDAAKAWRGIERSLGPEQYADFIAAFHGTPEAMLAAKHKRILQDWDALNKTDSSIVETFLASDLFPAMKERVRQFIAEEAPKVAALDELNRRLLQQQEAEKRLAREVEERAEAAKREAADRALAAKKEQDRQNEVRSAKTRRLILIVMAIVVLFVAVWIGVSTIPAAFERQAAEEEARAIEAELGIDPGEAFRDCPECPEMVVIRKGAFLMGDAAGETDDLSTEVPQRRVTVPAFAAGKYEVTWAEWDSCVVAGGCPRLKDDGFGGGAHPATNVSWDEAIAYTKWLSKKTGKAYRLLSEAEWEYAARAGTTSAYPWGSKASHEYANYGADNCCSGLSSGRDRWVNTSPAGSFEANAFGLHDMHGNVSEWVEDCDAGSSSAGLPNDGRPFTTGSCSIRVNRGGSWINDPTFLRSAYRYWSTPTDRNYFLGFRLARTL
jgi:formylglycine-generating enzyme required for sulfatase activity